MVENVTGDRGSPFPICEGITVNVLDTSFFTVTRPALSTPHMTGEQREDADGGLDPGGKRRRCEVLIQLVWVRAVGSGGIGKGVGGLAFLASCFGHTKLDLFRF